MKIFKAILAGISAFILIYLTGSFLSASFNIKNWHELLRGVIGIFGLIGAIILFYITLEKLEK